jgi:AcrR family transcriptional regulator
MPRPYEQKRRAESQSETRRRIVDATIRLHQTIGPNATTISEVARIAGVSRLTVYRHFPDQLSLLRACTREYNVRHPAPDADGLAGIHDPVRRLEAALPGIYAYYADNAAMLGNGAASVPTNPTLMAALAPFFEGQRQLVDLLASGWTVDSAPGSLLRAAIAHAISLPTWQALRDEQGLSGTQAVELMLGMILAARDASARKDSAKPGRT